MWPDPLKAMALRLARTLRRGKPAQGDRVQPGNPGCPEPLPDVHRGAIESQFDGRVAFAGHDHLAGRPLLVLAFTNRSGSNLLADYLLQTGGVAGLGEYLNSETVAAKSQEAGLASLPDYVAHLAQRLAHGTQQFGVKASAEQLRFLTEWQIHKMFASICVVHIHRDDLLGQAVSHWIARQTGQWTSLQPRQSDTVTFDGPRLVGIARDIVNADKAIRLHCAVEGLRYVSVSYEEVRADPLAATRRIGAAAGFGTGDWAPRPPRISRQSDNRNAALLRQLKDYIAHGGTGAGRD